MAGFNRGRFQLGHPKFGGRVKGTPNRRTLLLKLFRDSVSEEELRSIIAKNKRDALGVTIVLDTQGNQKLVDDPNSGANARARAREQIYDYLLGKAPQPIEISEEESAESVLARVDDNKLDTVIDAARIIRGGDSGDSGRSGDGAGASSGEKSPGSV